MHAPSGNEIAECAAHTAGKESALAGRPNVIAPTTPSMAVESAKAIEVLASYRSFHSSKR